MAIDQRRYLAPHRPTRAAGGERHGTSGLDVRQPQLTPQPDARTAGASAATGGARRAGRTRSATRGQTDPAMVAPRRARSKSSAHAVDGGPQHQRTAAELDGMLDGMQKEVEAGTNDTTLAARFGIRADDVRAWRRRQGLVGKRGRPKAEPHPLAHLIKPVPRSRLQRTLRTPGESTAPAYVERGELNYTLLGKLAFEAHRFGWTIEDIALATGVYDVDIGVAFEVYRDGCDEE